MGDAAPTDAAPTDAGPTDWVPTDWAPTDWATSDHRLLVAQQERFGDAKALNLDFES